MSAQRQQEVFFTYREYLSIENESNRRHEYYQGQIYAMAGTTSRHNSIAMSIARHLGNQLVGRPCQPHGMDQRLYIAEVDLSTYPDIMVACPPHRYSEEDSIALIDATVIVEILSPSTARYDRGTKFQAYQFLPSLRHYVLIETERTEVTHWRLENENWRDETFTDLGEMVNLSAVDCNLNLGDIYERIEFGNN